MSRLKQLARRPAQATGLLPMVHLRRRVDELEEALAESSRHEQALRAEVARIEATVGRIARSRAAGPREESHP